MREKRDALGAQDAHRALKIIQACNIYDLNMRYAIASSHTHTHTRVRLRLRTRNVKKVPISRIRRKLEGFLTLLMLLKFICQKHRVFLMTMQNFLANLMK
jgi:hypothetical protein